MSRESDVLDELFATVRFDVERGDDEVPDLAPEPDDPDDELTSTGVDSKGIRHVRTPAGALHFGQPIGSVIVADESVAVGSGPRSSKLTSISVVSSDFPGWEKYHGQDGNTYYVGKAEGYDGYSVTDENDEELHYEEGGYNSQENALIWLNDRAKKPITVNTPSRASNQPKPAPKPRRESRDAMYQRLQLEGHAQTIRDRQAERARALANPREGSSPPGFVPGATALTTAQENSLAVVQRAGGSINFRDRQGAHAGSLHALEKLGLLEAHRGDDGSQNYRITPAGYRHLGIKPSDATVAKPMGDAPAQRQLATLRGQLRNMDERFTRDYGGSQTNWPPAMVAQYNDLNRRVRNMERDLSPANPNNAKKPIRRKKGADVAYLEGKVVGSLELLLKRLQNPLDNQIKELPRWLPDGSEIVTIDQMAASLQVSPKVAATAVLEVKEGYEPGARAKSEVEQLHASISDQLVYQARQMLENAIDLRMMGEEWSRLNAERNAAVSGTEPAYGGKDVFGMNVRPGVHRGKPHVIEDRPRRRKLRQRARALCAHRKDDSPDYSDGIMIALMVPDAIGAQIALPDGLPKEELHITLAYLGKTKDLVKPADFVQKVLEAMTEVIPEASLIEGHIAGVGRFTNSPGDKDVLYYSYDSPTIGKVRADLVEALKAAEIKVDETHGFTPHISASYIPKNAPNPVEKIEQTSISFDTVFLVYGETAIPVKLGGNVQEPRIT